MFSVGVRDHVMIAHGFRGEVFGPAQALHGATYVVDVEFRCTEISDDGIVVDIARAHTQLKATLAEFNYKTSTSCRCSRARIRRPSSWRATSSGGCAKP